MLDFGDHEQELISAVGPLKCDVQLPPSYLENAHRTGQLLGSHPERRRHPRYRFGGCAALRYRQTFPSHPRPDGWHKIFTIDLSRGGLAFFHGEPLYPREKLLIVLPVQGDKMVEVVYCLRVQARCFRVGVRFVEKSEWSGAAEEKKAVSYVGRLSQDAPDADD